jgi:hypothetical protein
MAGYALAAGNASPGRAHWHAKVGTAPPCGRDVRSFSSCEPTMTSADSCPVTRRVATPRAVLTMPMRLLVRSLRLGQPPCRAPGSFRVRHDPAVDHSHRPHRLPNRPPQVRTRCVKAQVPHLPYTPYRWALPSGASSPRGARPSMRFLFVTSLLCTPASSGPVLANAPLPSASGCLAHNESKSVLPQGTCTPLHRAHAGRTPFNRGDVLKHASHLKR